MKYIEKYKDIYSNIGKVYSHADLGRYNFASKLIYGYSILNIGCGLGFFENLLIDKYENLDIISLDIKKSSKLIANSNVKYIYGDIRDYEKLPIADTVFCMEVVEHLDEEYNDNVINKLRLSARKRLVITVPFNEPYPLYHGDSPGGHRQNFDIEKINKYFPTSAKTIFPRSKVDWIFILEDKGKDYSDLELCRNDELLII